MQRTSDIIVIGAGIAGASAAAELAAYAKVVLLEMEVQPGYHATGRSAAFFEAAYGNSVVRGITAASGHFYRAPPEGFTEATLFRPRDCLFIGREDQLARLKAMQADSPSLQSVSAEVVCRQVPVLSAGYVAGGLCDDQGGDLDVDATLQGYLRLFRRRGGELACEQRVEAMHRVRGRWQLQCEEASFSAPIVVNAAGAWADSVAESARVGRLGIVPLRRTALLVDPPEGVDITDWPLVIDVDEEFYFKPDAAQLMISPADETPSDPCDAQPEMLDVATALRRFEKATGVQAHHVNHRWAGLRTFAPDRTFVAGFDPRTDGFFWLAGQGGYGVKSAPGMAYLTTALVTGSQLSEPFRSVLEYTEDVAPERLIERL